MEGNFGGGNVGEFGESSIIHQTKLVLTINNLLVDLLICQIFFLQMLETSQFAKISPHQSFPPYGIYSIALKFATDSHHRNYSINDCQFVTFDGLFTTSEASVNEQLECSK